MLEKIMSWQLLLVGMAVMGMVGTAGMCATHLTYRRRLKHTEQKSSLKEKWLKLWKTRDRLLHRMNRFVWYPTLLCSALFGMALYLSQILDIPQGLPLTYVYVGAAVPMILLLLRQALDFSYKEELVMDSLADYVDQLRTWTEETPREEQQDPLLKEEIVERITSSIRQTAAAGSHFSKMLTPQEEEIMREVIREFMEQP
ncbi:MAG: hypothetical protein Q4D55_02840 [Eubacteriales bacterium]|nr:hypothetical protein [Eubacteriales bacterium]